MPRAALLVSAVVVIAAACDDAPSECN